MYKLIDNTPADFDEPPIAILDPEEKRQSLIKRAADSRIQDYVVNLEPKPNKSYLHINAMTAGDYYGSNRNGDYFPENNLLSYYKTFETNPAHIFRSHINKDPNKSIGKVVYAIYNKRMHRVELIAEVDKDLAQDLEDRMAQGDFPSTSMACRTPYDFCSICGNKARSRAEYCQHLSTQLNQLMPDGRRAMAINSGPLKFFDLSIVIRPADVTSSVLQKVASDQEETIGSAQAAEEAGLTEPKQASLKEATLKKISDIQKQVDGDILQQSPVIEDILSQVEDPDNELIDLFAGVPLESLINGFASAGIQPSHPYMCEILARKHLGDAGKNRGREISELIRRKEPDDIPDFLFDHFKNVEPKPVEPGLARVLETQLKQASLFPEYIHERAIEKKADDWGERRPDDLRNPDYIPFTPEANGMPEGYPELPYGVSEWPQKPREEPKGKMDWVKSLLILGGLGLLSNYYINSLIDRKKDQAWRKEAGENIVLEKCAGMSGLADHLGLTGAIGLTGIGEMYREETKKGDKPKSPVKDEMANHPILTGFGVGGGAGAMLSKLKGKGIK